VCEDIIVPLPITLDCHKYVLVFSDRFSKFTVAVPMRTTTASDVAEAFVSRWIALFGVPLILLTDNGPQFASRFLMQVSAVLGVHQRFTSAYQASINGQVERFNRTVVEMLSHYVSRGTDWDKKLGPAMVAYNATVHSSTGFAPIEFLRMEAPRILLSSIPETGVPDKGTWRKKFLESLAIVGNTAKEKLGLMQERYKRAYDAHVRARNAALGPGDWVLVKVYTDSPKLTLPLAGPFEILQVDHRNGTFIIRTSDGRLSVPRDRVKPAPMPRDLPPEYRIGHTPLAEPFDNQTEFVIERLISHGKNDEGKWIVRVRWAGYRSDEDTWQDPRLLPRNNLTKYERKRGIQILFSSTIAGFGDDAQESWRKVNSRCA
jgi:transposase InsO family protein